MGYNLYIGEATVRPCLEERTASVCVEERHEANAPINSNEERSNVCYPSYSQWAEFCRNVGLCEVFFAGRANGVTTSAWWKDDEGKEHEGLIYRHPGAAPLEECHYRAFVKARAEYTGVVPEKNQYNHRRLDWLIWWTRWALDNCKYPTFYNS